jgi:DNA replication protein DnaC
MGAMHNLFKNFSCLAHGEYRKFDGDQNTNCPYCAQADAKADTLKNHHPIQSLLSIKTVKVGCLIHGFKEIQIPSSISEKVENTCDECRLLEKKPAIEAAINSRIQDEYLNANLPKNSLNMSFENLDLSQSSKQTLIVSTLIEDIKNLLGKGDALNHRNIYLGGAMGTGKTAMASIFMQNIIKRSVTCTSHDTNDIKYKNKLRCLFITEAQIIHDIKETWSNTSNNTVKAIIQRLSSVPILCIDDIGSLESSTHLFEAYSTILDERYKRHLPTIMTSNVAHDELYQLIGSRSADRFLESDRILVIKCDWGSYRQRKPIPVI